MYTDRDGNPTRLSSPWLWSDFDGTAVKHYPMYVPVNWTKYPVPRIPGYADFIHGVESEGVEIAGVVSRRPNWLRRPVTALSIMQHGLRPYYKSKSLVLAGSEEAKAAHVAREACKGRVTGMIDDKAFKFGKTLLEVIKDNHTQGPLPEVVIGATDTTHQLSDIEQLGNWATEQSDLVAYGDNKLVHIRGTDANFSVDVVALDPYSYEAGQTFGQILALK